MILERLWHLLRDRVFAAPSSDLLFNPYNGVDRVLDRPDADVIRRANLRGYLASFPAPPHSGPSAIPRRPGAWASGRGTSSDYSKAKITTSELMHKTM